jgi:2-keto-4-pentenoate hydratase/2-oxohepta-3-ene-1,7-dioic acid hydratase in catechol pathway
MPLVHFSHAGRARLGKLFGDHVVDFTAAAPRLPDTVSDFLAAGQKALDVFHAVEDDNTAAVALADVRLLPPVPKPEKYLGIGMNYRDHAAEAVKAGITMTPIKSGSISRYRASSVRSTT